MTRKRLIQALYSVKLQNTVDDELAFIERTHRHPEELREYAINAHAAVKKAKEALETAKKSETESGKWLHAYHCAYTADKAIVQYKQTAHLSCEPPFWKILLTIVGMPISSSLLSNRYPDAPVVDLLALVMLLAFLPQLTNAVVLIAYDFKLEVLEEDLIDLCWSKTVVEEARQFGINIDIHQPESQPWSNARILNDIGCEDIPEEYICDISMEPMTDPVSTESTAEHKPKYENGAIGRWLKIYGRDPRTDKPLSYENLIPNHSLKNAIDFFTHKKTKAYIQTTTLRSMLEHIEMEAEDRLNKTL